MKELEFVHFVGIGGVSMSGIAMELANQGLKISGSDVSTSKTNSYIREIESQGKIRLFVGHSADNILEKVDAVVITSTVSDKNPEVLMAKSLNIPILHRFEMINLIVKKYKHKIGIFGGAGKTTTTALSFFLFNSAKLDPSLFLGSVLQSLKSSVHLGEDKSFCIFETDESDATFAKMEMNVGIFVAMENDHLEHKMYRGSYTIMQEHFKDAILRLKKQNAPICYNIDSSETKMIVEETLSEYPLLRSFSIISKNAFFFADNIHSEHDGMRFDIYKQGKIFQKSVFIPLIGNFNVLNLLGALSSFSFFASDTECEVALSNLKNFTGIDKRQSKVGNFGNFDIIDDYAHSPLKIKTMLSGFCKFANAVNAGVIPVCEIHKFSRFSLMYEEFITCFNETKLLVLMDIYAVAGYKGAKPDLMKFIEDVRLQNQTIEILHISNQNLPKELRRLTERPEFTSNKRNFLLFFGAGLSSKYAKEMQGLLESVNLQDLHPL